MAELTAIVRTHLGQDIGALTQIDLTVHGIEKAFGTCDNALRVRETARHLTAMIAGKPGSGCLLRHALFSLVIAGVNVYLEADGVCFHTGGQLTIAEVKSFPAIDGVPDAAKTAAALLQSAVYVLALQETVRTLGYDPAIVSTRVLLVLTRDFSLKPVGFVRDIAPIVRRLNRRLGSVPVTADLAAVIPSDVVLPALPLPARTRDDGLSARWRMRSHRFLAASAMRAAHVRCFGSVVTKRAKAMPWPPRAQRSPRCAATSTR